MDSEEWMEVYRYAVEKTERYGAGPDIDPYELLVDTKSGTFGLAAPRKDRSAAPQILHRARSVAEIQAWRNEQMMQTEAVYWIWNSGGRPDPGLVKRDLFWDMVGRCWKFREGERWTALGPGDIVYDLTDDQAAAWNASYVKARQAEAEAYQGINSVFASIKEFGRRSPTLSAERTMTEPGA